MRRVPVAAARNTRSAVEVVTDTQPQSCAELYCGIGGFAAAVQTLRQPTGVLRYQVTSAWDIDVGALDVYRLNFPGHAATPAEIRSLDIARLRAELWWLSPPCLPFTRKGNQRDDADPRTESLLTLIGKLTPDLTFPQSVAIENVPPFATSRTAGRIVRHLESIGFHVNWELRCPSELGWPMRRLRCYLIASRRPLLPLAPATHDPIALRSLLDRDSEQDASLAVPREWLEGYRQAIDLIDPDDPTSQAACFTSSYGRTPVRSGSYLRRGPGEPPNARFFSPTEVLRLLGFPADFRWPPELNRRRRWALAGNSLSLPVVRRILSRLPAPAAPSELNPVSPT